MTYLLAKSEKRIIDLNISDNNALSITLTEVNTCIQI